MGDLVLFQDEVNPVLSELLDSRARSDRAPQPLLLRRSEGLLHAHRGRGTGGAARQGRPPGARQGEGDPQRRLRRPARASAAAPLPATSSITAKTVEDALGVKGQAKDGMFKVVIGRTAKAACGCDDRQGDGREHLGGLRGLGRQRRRRRRLRHAGDRAARRAEGAAQGRHQHRGHPPPHGRRDAARTCSCTTGAADASTR